MNKMTAIVFLILIVIIAVFGFIVLSDLNFENANNSNNTGNESVTMLSVSKGGVTVNYPSNWVYSQSTSNNSIIAISKESHVDNLEVGQVNINVEKKEFNGTFDTFINKTYTNLQADNNFEIMSSGEVAINNEKALEYIYSSNSSNGVIKQHKAVWFEKGNTAYVILYSAPVDKYESNLPAADYIIQHIQIK